MLPFAWWRYHRTASNMSPLIANEQQRNCVRNLIVWVWNMRIITMPGHQPYVFCNWVSMLSFRTLYDKYFTLYHNVWVSGLKLLFSLRMNCGRPIIWMWLNIVILKQFKQSLYSNFLSGMRFSSVFISLTANLHIHRNQVIGTPVLKFTVM